MAQDAQPGPGCTFPSCGAGRESPGGRITTALRAAADAGSFRGGGGRHCFGRSAPPCAGDTGERRAEGSKNGKPQGSGMGQPSLPPKKGRFSRSSRAGGLLLLRRCSSEVFLAMAR